MTTAEAFAPAKINLALRLTGVRDDGYHLLESLVVFARDVGDRVCVSAADGLSLTVTGPMAPGVPTDGTNLVMRAAGRLRELRGVSAGADITLDKQLPNGAGIGGGSSDAAAGIRALSQLWGVDPLTGDEALALGADLPVCLAAPSPAIVRGIGEIVQRVDLPPLWLVLVNPGVPVSTGRVFALHDSLHDFSLLGLDPLGQSPPAADLHVWLADQRNDLTKVVCKDGLAPIVSDVLKALRATGCLVAEMSGSGSTCWGLFADKRTAARVCAAIAADHPDWWCRVTRTAP